MKKKTVTLVCLVSMFSLLGGLTSCSREDNSRTIEFWHTFGQGIQGVVQQKINEFTTLVKENEGVDIKIKQAYQGNYTDIQNKVSKGFSAGYVPTITVAYPDHVANYIQLQQIAKKNYVVNLQELMDDPATAFGACPEYGEDPEINEEDIVPAFFDEGKHFTEEGTYTLPFMKSSEVMFYNVEAVEAALIACGIETSADAFLKNITWDEFMQFNRDILAHKSEISNTLDRPCFYDSDSNMFITKMYQNNIALSKINDKGVGTVGFKTGENYDAAKAMVLRLKSAYDEGILNTKGCYGKYGSDAFLEQKCIFSIGSSGGAGYNLPSSDEFTVGIVKVPYENNRPYYVTQGPCLAMLNNPGSKAEDNDFKREYAWKFVKFLLEPSNNVETCIVGSQGYIPVRNSCYETDAFQEFLKEGEDFAQTAKILLSDIDGHYLNTEVFPGSAALRDACGFIITQSLLSKNIEKEIDGIFSTNIYNAELSFH